MSRFDLGGKTALVTGGAGLLGEPVSEALSDHGATVLVAEVDQERGKDVVDELDGEGHFVEMDVTDELSVESTVAAAAEEFGGIDILVNTAYPRNDNYGQPFERVGYDDWRENVDLHLNSYYLVTSTVARSMIDRRAGGSIINFGSIYGSQAPDFGVYDGTDMTSPVEYAAIKGGIINLSRYLASYLGRYDIRVNVVSPGGVFDEQPEQFVEQYERRTPLSRMAHPEDVQGAVVYLASDSAAYVTGHNLLVDGGWSVS